MAENDSKPKRFFRILIKVGNTNFPTDYLSNSIQASAMAIMTVFMMLYEEETRTFVLRHMPRVELTTVERVGLVIFSFLAGVILFYLRKNMQIVYGFLEIMFALLVAWEASGKWVDNPIAGTSAVGASVYLIVRGLTNLDDGRKKYLQRRHVELAQTATEVETASKKL